MSHARPMLAVRRSVVVPRRGERIAWLVLAALACTVAHEGTYQLLYPGRDAYRTAMTLLGHGASWLALSLAVGLATLALVAVVGLQLRRLRREAAITPALATSEDPGIRSYLRLVLPTWLRLGVLAAILYTSQENLEALAAGLPVRGLDVILGHGLLPLGVVLLATLLMALAVALVRWRRRALLGRIAAAARPWPRRVARAPRPTSARAARSRRLGWARASRAPPLVATPNAL